jgi:uncharacterized metal-binding protein YceD (DUF177 family)
MQKKVVNNVIELCNLVANRKANFKLEFTQKFGNLIKSQLNILDVQKVKFLGTLAPLGKGDWRLTGIIGASIEQSCSITLDPVVTRVESKVLRNFRRTANAGLINPNHDETIIDDSDEIFNKTIDLENIFYEELSLLLPDYPKKENIKHQKTDYGPPGVSPITDKTSKPFSVLSDFKDRLT